MSRKTRTENWMAGKIIETLARKQEITIDFVRSTEEQHNFAIALQLLLSKKEISREKDSNGLTIYKLQISRTNIILMEKLRC